LTFDTVSSKQLVCEVVMFYKIIFNIACAKVQEKLSTEAGS